MNGGWGKWNEWEPCKLRKGKCSKKRSRLCNNPIPENQGDHCNVDGSSSTKTIGCKNITCESKYRK